MKNPTKKVLATYIANLEVTIGLCEKKARDCRAFRIQNKHTKSALLAHIDMLHDYQAAMEKEDILNWVDMPETMQ